MPKFALLVALAKLRGHGFGEHPIMYSDAILEALKGVGVESKLYPIDRKAFQEHVATCNYPPNYAGGPVDEGGKREKKLLEYFVSLNLLAVQPTDVVIDVASEWSVFPEVLRKLTGATVYRQDLVYPAGISGDRIGGSAAAMPIPDMFADKLVLHNSFEQFEGSADSDLVPEAWRVLKPGGVVCIVPLFLSESYANLTDPLVNRRGIVWDEGARVVERPWWHNRFGRFYDAEALRRRVLNPARQLGFDISVYHFVNVQEIWSSGRFGLILRKPADA